MPPRPSHSVLYWLRPPFISLQRHRLASRAAVRHPIRIYERVSMLGVGNTWRAKENRSWEIRTSLLGCIGRSSLSSSTQCSVWHIVGAQ